MRETKLESELVRESEKAIWRASERDRDQERDGHRERQRARRNRRARES